MSQLGENVVVLFGGTSDEARVSVASAQNLISGMKEAIPWFMTREGKVNLCTREELLNFTQPFEKDFKPSKPNAFSSLRAALAEQSDKEVVFFVGLHGGGGEDGTVQREFEAFGLGFTGAGSVASALAFDKERAKAVASSQGILVADSAAIEDAENPDAETTIKQLLSKHGRLVLKPIAGGSSIGMFQVHNPSEIGPVLMQMQEKKVPYLAEQFLSGRELTIGVYEEGSQMIPLPPSEVKLESGHEFDFEGKYLGRGSVEITPAKISKEETLACQKLAMTVHKALGCYGYSRTDVIMAENGVLFFIELNTLPGLTSASFIPQQLEAASVSFSRFLSSQIELARARTNLDQVG